MTPKIWPILICFGFMALVFSLQGAISPVINNFDGRDGYSLPLRLSATGLFKNISSASRTVTEGIVYFEVNSPLWTDGAYKERYLALPTGKSITPTDTDSYRYPSQTVFIKNFFLDTIYGDTTTRILIETRFLVLNPTMEIETSPWHGISYRWRRDQSDADLVSQDLGENLIINIQKNGLTQGKRWTFPSKNQCITCHFNRGVLGFITPQLNRPSRTDTALNQLQDLTNRGVLISNPIVNWPLALRWAGLKDTTASLEFRARSYFAGNCSHCHGTLAHPGNHNFDFYHLDFKIEQGLDGQDGAYVGKRTHQGGDLYPQFIYKGYPESSYVLKRMSVRQDFGFTPTEQMPTLGTFQPDSLALNLLRDWICSLGYRSPGFCHLPEVQEDRSFWDSASTTIPGHILNISQKSAPAIPNAKGFNLLGRRVLNRLEWIGSEYFRPHP
jgi:hypothetical protein